MNLAESLQPPSWQHFLGTDSFGNDLAQKITQGFFHTIWIALITSIFTLLLAVLISYFVSISGAKIERLYHILVDVLFAFPGFLLAILLATIMPSNSYTAFFVLSMTGWVGYSRFFLFQFKKIAAEPFVEAARSVGAETSRIYSWHILPSLYPHLLVQLVLCFGYAILGEASLSYLGLGVPIDQPSLGKLIAEGRQYLIEAPHLSIFPGFILFTLLATLFQVSGRLGKKSSKVYNT